MNSEGKRPERGCLAGPNQEGNQWKYSHPTGSTPVVVGLLKNVCFLRQGTDVRTVNVLFQLATVKCTPIPQSLDVGPRLFLQLKDEFSTVFLKSITYDFQVLLFFFFLMFIFEGEGQNMSGRAAETERGTESEAGSGL